MPQAVKDVVNRQPLLIRKDIPLVKDELDTLVAQTGEDAKRITSVWGDNPDAVRAISKALDTSAQDLQTAQWRLKQNPADTASLENMLTSMVRHQALQEAAGARVPDAGNTLRKITASSGGKEATFKALSDMGKRMKMSDEELGQHLAQVDLSDPEKLQSLTKIARDYNFGDRAAALWYFSLLSSPTTHIRNMVGNTITGLTAPLETAGASVFDPLARRIVGDTGPRQRYLGEAWREYAGMKDQAIPAVTNGLRALAGDMPLAATGDIPELTREAFRGAGPGGVVGGVIHSPSRALQAEDQIARTMNQGAAMNAIAYRTAKMEGLEGQALADRMEHLLKAPTADMLDAAQQQVLDQARGVATYRVFQQESEAANAIRKIPGIQAVMPFTRTPINVLKYGLERSPAGAINVVKDMIFRRGALAEQGAGELADRMSRATIGTAVWMALLAKAQDGDLTGAVPRDPKERDAFYRDGKQAYSFRNPVDGNWTSYLALQPFSPLLASAAAAIDAKNRGLVDDRDVGAIAAMMGTAIGQATLSQGFTSGLADGLDLIHNGSADPANDLKKWAMSQAGSVVPGAIRTVARMTDDIVRDPQDPLQAIEANIPGLQQNVPERINAFGGVRHRPLGGIESALNVFPGSKEDYSPVEAELKRLSDKTYDVQPGFVGKDITVEGLGPAKLTPEQEQRYQSIAGAYSYAILASEIGTDAWNKLTDPEKEKEIQRVYGDMRQMAREIMTPGVLGQAATARRRDLQRKGLLPEASAVGAAAETGAP